FLMECLASLINAPVVPAEAIHTDGDAVEAEAWAYLAVRSLRGLPLTWPGTTGTSEPVSGGLVFVPADT
ncbi:MAG: anhydro-N-acetylmuramic acid kinase, partial [Anderseniella sp.]|nr:anhydro-N-acetylmuramic acid kinase [Anderseniella sp.]